MQPESKATMSDAAHDEEAPDRRTSQRFPLRQEIRHRGFGGADFSGSGKTVNISCRGVLFSTSGLLRRGDEIEIHIDWPAQLSRRMGLRLVARGRVVRTEPGLAAMRILQHEFRTQLRKPPEP